MADFVVFKNFKRLLNSTLKIIKRIEIILVSIRKTLEFIDKHF
ncbi:hypothetical protein [Clostridium perfringens]